MLVYAFDIEQLLGNCWP